MRFFLTLPKNQDFFKTYAKIAKGIQASTYFTQVVSALTESVIIYSLLFSTLSFLLSPILALIFSFIGSILGTAVLEIGLRFFLPHSIDAFLYQRKEGLYLAMSIFIISMTIALVISSGYLSFIGSKSYIKNNAPTLTPKTTALVDSTYIANKNDLLSTFKNDSTTIANHAAQLITASEKAHNSSISERQIKLNTLPKSKTETWGQWNAKKNAIRSDIKRVAVERDAKTASLTNDKIEQQKALKTAKNEKLLTLENSYKIASLDIKKGNEKAQSKIDATAEKQGLGLGWITIIFLLYFIVCTTIERIHKKGSGIEETPIPTDYYFRASILSEGLNAISERLNQTARQYITDFQAKTLAPPLPIAPHQLINIANFEQQSYNLDFGTNAAPILASGNDKNTDETDGKNTDFEEIEVLENKIIDTVEAVVKLEENNLHEQAQVLEVKAKFVINEYLTRDGRMTTDDEKLDLYNKLLARANDDKLPNCFDAIRPQIIGFKTQKMQSQNASETKPTNATNEGLNAMRMTQQTQDTNASQKTQHDTQNSNRKIKHCLHCNNQFTYRTTWQKYCKTECRTAAWESRTGKPLMMKKAKK